MPQDNESAEFAIFADAIGEVEHDYEFVVIDTPASDSYLMRLAHSLADTLISPMNDSFIDMDVLTRVHHDRGAARQWSRNMPKSCSRPGASAASWTMA